MEQTQKKSTENTGTVATASTGLFPASPQAWQEFREQAKQESRKLLIQSEKEWLSNVALEKLVYGGIQAEAIETREVTSLLSSETSIPGTLKQATLSLSPSGAGTISLRFHGNNLKDPSYGEDARIELDFSTSHLDTADKEHVVKALEKKISEIIALSSDDIRGLESISEVPTVQQIKEALGESGACIHALGLSNCRMASETAFAHAVIRGIVPDSGKRLLHDLSQTELHHVELDQVSFSGLEGHLTHCKIHACDARGALFHIHTDTHSRITELSAYGALLSGDINCPVDGDFRKARLGGSKKQNRLSGKTFQLTDNALSSHSISLLKKSVFSLSESSEGTPSLTLNAQEVFVRSGARRESSENLMKTPEFKKVLNIPAGGSALSRFLSERLPGAVEKRQIIEGQHHEYLFALHGQADVFGSLVSCERPVSTSYSLKIYQTPVLDYDASTQQSTAETRELEFKPILKEECKDDVLLIAPGPVHASDISYSIPYSPHYARPLAAVMPAEDSAASLAGPLLYMRRLIRMALDHEYKQLLAQAHQEEDKKRKRTG